MATPTTLTLTHPDPSVILGFKKVKSDWRNCNVSVPCYQVLARRLGADLCCYAHPIKSNLNTWRVLHRPTGWCIADVNYDLLQTVRHSFEAFTWQIDADTGVFTTRSGSIVSTIRAQLRYTITEETI